MQLTLLEDIFNSAGSALPSDVNQRLAAEKGNKVPSPFAAICGCFRYLEERAYPLLSTYVMMKVSASVSDEDGRRIGIDNEGRKRSSWFSVLVLFVKSLLMMTGASGPGGVPKNDAQDIQNLGSLSITG